MNEEKGMSFGLIAGLVLLAALGLWVVWGLVSAVFALVKIVLTLAVAGAALYGVYRVLKALERSDS